MWEDEAKKLKAQGKSWTQIGNILKDEFPGLSEVQRRDKVRAPFRNKTKTAVGILGDLHQPFTHPNYLKFARDTFKKNKVGTVVCIGDE